MVKENDSPTDVRAVLNRAVMIPTLLMAAVGALLFWQINRLVELARWVDHTDKVIAQAALVERLLVDKETGVRGYVATGEDLFLEPYEAGNEVLESRFDELQASVKDNPDQERRVREIREEHGRWEAEAASPILDLQRRKSPIPLELHRIGKTHMDRMRAQIGQFTRVETNLRDSRSSAAQNASSTVLWVGGGMILAIAVFIALFTRRQLFSVSSAFGKALSESHERAGALQVSEKELAARVEAETASKEELARAVRIYGAFIGRLARGDLSASVEPTGGPELRQLGEDLGAMGHALRTMTVRINEAVVALSSATSEILAVTQEQSAITVETASAVTKTVVTVEEVTQTAQQVADRAKAVSIASQRSVEVSSSGQKAVDQSLGAMDRVNTQVTSISERILVLSEQAQAVGQIITTVNELAEQSNLLALNASIEAARAGEHGRSFAVVAQEVRRLAEQSKDATNKVRGILGEIQRSTNAAVLATEEGTKTVNSAVETAQVAGERIQQLAATISQAASAAAQIVAAAEEQVIVIGQTSQAVRAIEQAASQTVEGTRQSERAARDIGDLATRLGDAVAQYRT
ncbi:methyl-accepting chemotaxis protein [Chondromyces apiculatus]|uniref:Methyl-accepting chemotaxis sensory transducer n=1 Tax=Chondromyces apiculatus DSM 436 TaxID=1192034 RepID=A0A017T651_9BACT|nr:methyl-accepting chemotaxis protein [Chondromyces apiculatus]EYF04748.1 methyl-accepting chemotaxis sensory transducer [Chondromyces apiculatus DSM 436]